MFLKGNVRKKNNKTYNYFYIVEGHRDENNKVKQKTVFKIGDVPREVAENILMAFKGTAFFDINDIIIEKSYEYGASMFLNEVWKKSGIDKILDKKYAYRIKMMALNRLIDPRSKNDLVNWYTGSFFSKDKLENELNYENLYRAMDYLEEHQERIEEALNDHESKKIFYDITSSYFEGHHCEMSDYGYSRDHRKDEKQVVISLAINEEKQPLAIKVLAGNTADVSTVEERMLGFKNRFNLKDNCVIMDKGMVSKNNISKIIENGFEYILALKLNNEIKEIITANKNIEYQKYDETLRIKEIVSGNKKHIICHSTYKDFTDKESRKSRITKAIGELSKLKEKKFKDHDELVEKVSKIIFRFKVSKYLKVEYFEKAFEYSPLSINEEFDGIFTLETSKLDIPANTALEQYKNLKAIERCFRELKDFLELRPMYHYKNQRVKAHVFICFLSYYIYSIIDQQLCKAKINMSVETLLDNLKKITASDLVCKNAKTTKISVIPSELIETVTALGYKTIAKI